MFGRKQKAERKTFEISSTSIEGLTRCEPPVDESSRRCFSKRRELDRRVESNRTAGEVCRDNARLRSIPRRRPPFKGRARALRMRERRGRAFGVAFEDRDLAARSYVETPFAAQFRFVAPPLPSVNRIRRARLGSDHEISSMEARSFLLRISSRHDNSIESFFQTYRCKSMFRIFEKEVGPFVSSDLVARNRATRETETISGDDRRR